MKRRPSLESAKNAFTLIELLVVIAILSILAGILLPVFGRVRENGRRAACQSNLRQIGLGLIQYSQDYDEILIADWYSTNNSPGLTDAATTPNPEYKWMDAAYPYIKSQQIFTCPSASGIRAKPWIYYGNLAPGTQLGNGATDRSYGSYVIMHGYGPLVAGKTPPVSHPQAPEIVNLSVAAVPSTTAWVMDGDNDVETFYAQRDSVAASPTFDTLIPVQERHLSTLNILFLDGHVKALKLDAVNRKNAAGVISMATIQDD